MIREQILNIVFWSLVWIAFLSFLLANAKKNDEAIHRYLTNQANIEVQNNWRPAR